LPSELRKVGRFPGCPEIFNAVVELVVVENVE
jgi:hypothetical protein